jgi:hypothetical protein
VERIVDARHDAESMRVIRRQGAKRRAYV